MPSRYRETKRLINTDERYRSFMRKRSDFQALEGGRQLKKITHYGTNLLFYPSEQQMASLDLNPHIWSVTDRLTLLSNQHYGTPDLWWVIAFLNKKPTEFHFTPGEVIMIPHPIETMLAIMGI